MTPHEEQQRALSYVLEEMGVDTRIANNLRRYCPKCRIAILTDKRSWALEVIDGQYDEILLTHTKNIGPNSIKKLKVSLKQWLNDPAPLSEAAPKPEPAQPTTYTITTTKYWEHVNLCHYMYLLSSEAEHKGIHDEELAAVSLLLQRVMDSWRHWYVDRAEERIFVSTIEQVLAEFREEDQPDET